MSCGRRDSVAGDFDRNRRRRDDDVVLDVDRVIVRADEVIIRADRIRIKQDDDRRRNRFDDDRHRRRNRFDDDVLGAEDFNNRRDNRRCPWIFSI